MIDFCERCGGAMAAAVCGFAAFVGQADAQVLVVTNGDTLELTELDDSPFSTDGARIGPSITDLPGDPVVGTPTSGTVIVGENVEWTNTGQFYVGSHFGIQDAAGTVEFMPGSVFNSIATAPGAIPPQDVRIGQGGTGIVTLHDGAVWNNTGQVNTVSFFVNDGGTLLVEGQLLSDASSVIMGGSVTVHGEAAEWQVGGFGLDIEGFGANVGELIVTGGGRVHEMPFFQVGFSAGNTGTAVVGDENDAVTSSLQASIIELGVFSAVNPSNGTLTVNANGRVDTDILRLGRGGGTGSLVVNQGGEVLVGGFFGGGFFGQFIEIWDGGTIDLSTGGKVVIGTNTAPFSEPGLGTPNEFDNIADGTLLVGGGGGLLKGTGTILGDVVVAAGGTVNAGHSAGTLNIVGDLTLENDGILTIEVSSATLFDQINVSGLLTLGGTLNLVFIDGFTPAEGENFSLDIFGGANLAGAFATVTSEGLGDDLFADVDLEALAAGQPLDFTVAAVPEPASIVVLLLGVAALSRRA